MPDRYDLVIVGVGAGGLLAAELAASIGLRVAAVERDRVGGDRVWTGSVPSNALAASARAADRMRHADRYGLEPVEPTIDLAAVWRHIRAVQDDDGQLGPGSGRLADLGVELLHGDACVDRPERGHRRGPRCSTRATSCCAPAAGRGPSTCPGSAPPRR